jgi:hypothetical protein
MCSIIGSFNKAKVKELIILNQERGSFSYSISLLDIENMKIIEQVKDFGLFDFDKLDEYKDDINIYYICHIQSPTSGLINDKNRIHPTRIFESYLWHNGIIKSINNEDIIRFDTLTMHEYLFNEGFDILSDIEGLFSCLYIDDSIAYIFRTKHGKLYIDDDLNISSERFENSKCINSDLIYSLDFKNKNIIIEDQFKTKKYNYIIKGEL